jgi:hypothetical protein
LRKVLECRRSTLVEWHNAPDQLPGRF